MKNLIRENTDYLYTETYILETKKEIDPVGGTEHRGISKLMVLPGRISVTCLV